MVTIILAGGQTGADQAAHRAARDSGLLCAGWCPPDRSCDSGPIPGWIPVQPTPCERSERAPDVSRSLRTEWNVRDSDATLIIRWIGAGDSRPADPGTEWTLTAANEYVRPVYALEVDMETNAQATLNDLINWIRANDVRVLNIAGPSDCTAPDAGPWTYEFLRKLFANSSPRPEDART